MTSFLAFLSSPYGLVLRSPLKWALFLFTDRVAHLSRYSMIGGQKRVDSMDSIEARVKRVTQEVFNLNELPDDLAHFEDSFEADSLDKFEFLMCLEAEFHIELPDEIAMRVSTVGDAVKEIKAVLEH